MAAGTDEGEEAGRLDGHLLRSNQRRVFVTVGSTEFTDLVAAMLSNKVVETLANVCAPASPLLTIQYGATPLADILTAPGSALIHMQDASSTSGTLNTSRIASFSGGDDSDEQAESKEAANSNERFLDDKELAATFRLHKVRRDVEEDASSDVDQSKMNHSRQCFTFRIPFKQYANTVSIELVNYVDSITPYLCASDIVITHAGSGTILDALRLNDAEKPKVVVVPNEMLMDNHQTELASALAKQNFVIATRVGKMSSDGQDNSNKIPALLQALFSTDQAQEPPPLAPFPPAVPGRFRSLVDAEMGFN